MEPYILSFDEIDLNDISVVGGKNASLGEMYQNLNEKGINVPEGFATTSFAYREFLQLNNLEVGIIKLLAELDTGEFTNLKAIGKQIRDLILNATIQEPLVRTIFLAYKEISNKYKSPIQVAVRSSATAEDLPNASFAGQHESYLNISGEEQLIKTCLKCYASLFTDRAIKYRHDHGFDHMKVYLSLGIQKMVRSDKGSAGVCFTIDPESGFENSIIITGSWGLGENVVQGAVDPDEFYVFKPTLKIHKQAIVSRKLGSKLLTMVYAEEKGEEASTVNIKTPREKRNAFILSDEEVLRIAQWSLAIEEHYKMPMDIEWAKDGETEKIFIVQARPETIYGSKRKSLSIKQYSLKEKGQILTRGKGIGNKIISSIARILHSPQDSDLLQKGEVLVTGITNPDWDPVLKKASAIITNRGGRTSHAAIVAREMGALAVVGTGNATDVIHDGDKVTVVCEDGVNGLIYKGKLKFEEKELDFEDFDLPKTEAKFILADPDKAFQFSSYPNNGVGLLRLEFIITNSIQVHPMALARFDQVVNLEARTKIEEITRL